MNKEKIIILVIFILCFSIVSIVFLGEITGAFSFNNFFLSENLETPTILELDCPWGYEEPIQEESYYVKFENLEKNRCIQYKGVKLKIIDTNPHWIKFETLFGTLTKEYDISKDELKEVGEVKVMIEKIRVMPNGKELCDVILYDKAKLDAQGLLGVEEIKEISSVDVGCDVENFDLDKYNTGNAVCLDKGGICKVVLYQIKKEYYSTLDQSCEGTLQMETTEREFKSCDQELTEEETCSLNFVLINEAGRPSKVGEPNSGDYLLTQKPLQVLCC